MQLTDFAAWFRCIAAAQPANADSLRLERSFALLGA
jgi:hypothetical protein